MDGLLVIDKPSGPTSHDVVARMRRVLGERRIGHTGTLDPMATGVLPLVLGRATRLARFLSAGDKAYEAEIRLGVATDTHDAHGTAAGAAHQGAWPTRDAIERALETFRGTFVQQPPAFSAKKIDGRRSYQLARARANDAHGAHAAQAARLKARATLLSDLPGLPDLPDPPDLPDRPDPVAVTVHRLELVNVESDRVTLRLVCSAGFYVRSLAHDLGERLAVGGHLAALRRTRSGPCSLAAALTLDEAEHDRDAARAAVVPLDRMLQDLPAVALTEAGAERAAHGRTLESGDVAGRGAAAPYVRLLGPSGQLIGIAEPAAAPGLLHPSVVLV